jgi:hypothetical protein
MASDVPDPAAAGSDAQMLQSARRRAGTPGVILAGAMLGLRDVLEGKPKEDVAVVVASPTEPTDIDNDGIAVTAGDVTMHAPALPHHERTVIPRHRRRRG